MGDGFDKSIVDMKRRFDKFFAITSDGTADNLKTRAGDAIDGLKLIGDLPYDALRTPHIRLRL